MPILLNDKYTAELESALRESIASANFFSAYIKISVVHWIATKAPDHIDINVVARWQKQDLKVGSSDLEVYEFCRDRGWRFGVSLPLHAKLFIIDRQTAFVGSANLTGRGLSLSEVGNFEAGVVVPAADIDLLHLDRFLLNDVTWINDELYERIQRELTNESNSSVEEAWSEGLMDMLKSDVSAFWIHELPHGSVMANVERFGASDVSPHDRDLFSLPEEGQLTREQLADAFRKSKIYAFLKDSLEQSPDINFGKLSALLHDAIIDDPKPYRRDVKQLVSNVFSWVELCSEEIVVLRHARTKSMRLTSRLSGV